MKAIKNFLKKYLPGSVLRMRKKWQINQAYKKIAPNYVGNEVYCPCCNQSFSGFIPFEYREDPNFNAALYINSPANVICPRCKSLPRHRITCDYLEKNQTLTHSSKVLIFAAPYAFEVWFKRKKLRYLSADLLDRTAHKKVDIQKTPFHDNEFDFISCDNVLEHVDDYIIALRELFRIAKKGGLVEITVPLFPSQSATYEDASITDPRERILAFGQIDHLRVFGTDFYEKLKIIGFKVSLYDGDTCDKKIVPLTAPATYDYNKIIICQKP